MRSCRRWQLYVLQSVLRVALQLGMHLGFHDSRRSHVAPMEPTIWLFYLVSGFAAAFAVRASIEYSALRRLAIAVLFPALRALNFRLLDTS